MNEPNEPVVKKTLPAKAIASVLFACSSLAMFHAYERVRGLPTRFANGSEDVYKQVLEMTRPIGYELNLAYWAAAVLALIWCLWSWRAESRAAALMATVVTAFALFAAVFIVV